MSVCELRGKLIRLAGRGTVLRAGTLLSFAGLSIASFFRNGSTSSR